MAHGLVILLSVICLSAGVSSVSLSDSVQPFYDATEKFLDFIQPLDTSVFITDVLTVLINDTGRGNSSQQFDWKAVVTRYWQNMMGYFILVCIGIAIIILIPLIGFISCCCRCCCKKCGGRGRLREKRGSGWRRVLFGVLLCVLVTAMLLGVVLAFISNQLVREQMDPSLGRPTMLANFSSDINGVATLLSQIPVRAKNNSFSAVVALIAAIYPAVDISMANLRDTLGSSSKADTVLANALQATQLLSQAHSFSESYLRNHGSYSANLNNLDSLLADLNSNLTGVDSNCPFNAIQSDCNLIANRLPKLRVSQDANATGLLNVTQLNNLMRKVNDTDLTLRLMMAQQALNNVSNAARVYATGYAREVQSSLNSSAELEQIWIAVEQLFNSLNRFIKNSSYSVNNTVVDPITHQFSTLDEAASNVDFVRYIVFIVIASIGSLVIVLCYLGVAYGLCGEPPHEDARCCNRGVGARFLTAGLVISFATYALLFATILVLFLTGGLSDTEVCRYLTGRKGASGYKHLDASLNQIISASSPDLNTYSLNIVSGLLDGCSGGNASITAALNIENLVRGSHISNRVEQFVNGTNDLLQNRRIELVSRVALDLNLTDAESVAFSAAAQPLLPFLTELRKPLIDGAETVFAAMQNISITASRAEDRNRFAALVAYVDSTMRLAETLQQSELKSMEGLSTSLQKLNATVSGITRRLLDAESALHTPYNLEMSINVAMANLTAQLQVNVRDTVALVVGAAADCAALNARVRSLITGTCVNFLRPYNGFWAGIGLFLICLIPSLILTFKLVNLFLKEHRYHPEYTDKIQTLLSTYNQRLNNDSSVFNTSTV